LHSPLANSTFYPKQEVVSSAVLSAFSTGISKDILRPIGRKLKFWNLNIKLRFISIENTNEKYCDS